MAISRKTGEVYYTDEEKEKALQNTNALKYALSHGYQLIRTGNEYRLKEHDSMVFELNGKWHWNSRGLHGDALDLLQEYEGYSYQEAICELAGTLSGQLPVVPIFNTPLLEPEEKKEFILPERADNFKILFAYLIKERCLDPVLVKDFVNKHKIYQGVNYSALKIVGYDKDGRARYTVKEKYKDDFKNAVFEHIQVNNGCKAQQFSERVCLPIPYVSKLLSDGKIKLFNNLVMVGYDQDSIARYASQRSMSSFGKPFKVDVDGSDKSYPFVLEGKPDSDTVCVFESPIEAMSYWSLCKETGSDRMDCPLMSLGGANSMLALDRYLAENLQIKQIVIGLNNDSQEFGHTINAGRNGAVRINEKYGGEYHIIKHQPHLNDWNDVLKNYRKNLMLVMQDLNKSTVQAVHSEHHRKSMDRAI